MATSWKPNYCWSVFTRAFSQTLLFIPIWNLDLMWSRCSSSWICIGHMSHLPPSCLSTLHTGVKFTGSHWSPQSLTEGLKDSLLPQTAHSLSELLLLQLPSPILALAIYKILKPYNLYPMTWALVNILPFSKHAPLSMPMLVCLQWYLYSLSSFQLLW